MYSIKFTEVDGRGLYASQNFMPDKLITQCELLVLSAEDTLKVNETSLQYYTFKFNETQDCLVLGNAELFNHSDEANVRYELEDFDGRKVMRFYSTKLISINEQLYINYNQDVNVSVDSYINSKSLAG
jgi:hypothetical protein